MLENAVLDLSLPAKDHYIYDAAEEPVFELSDIYIFCARIPCTVGCGHKSELAVMLPIPADFIDGEYDGADKVTVEQLLEDFGPDMEWASQEAVKNTAYIQGLKCEDCAPRAKLANGPESLDWKVLRS